MVGRTACGLTLRAALSLRNFGTRAATRSAAAAASKNRHAPATYARASEAQYKPGGPPPTTTDGKPPSKTPWIKFCCSCGGPVTQAIPPGEDRYRTVCTQCSRVDYQNPKMVAGCVVLHEGQVLLCRRAIEPCKGLWTLPAGYVELGESVAQGAARETWEEAYAAVTPLQPYAQMDIPRIGQSYMLYRADLDEPHTFRPGTETLETRLFAPEDIPFGEIAFSAITVVLQLLVEDLRAGSFRVHQGVIHKKDGFSPSDPNGYELRDHVAVLTTVRTPGASTSPSVN